ncbi:MAG: hemolysin family protein [Anaerolineaceae bacterium]
MNFLNVLLLVLLIGFNAFFVAFEYAVVTSRRSRLDILADSESGAAKLVRSWIESPASRERMIAASQLGITIIGLALGAVGENSFAAWLEPYFQNETLPDSLHFLSSVLPYLPFIISLLVITSFTVVMGETVPKVAVLRAPEKFALGAAPFMQFFNGIFKWFISSLGWATRGVLSILGIQSTSSLSSAVSLEELRQIVSGPEVENAIEKPEREMLSAVIDFGEMVVRQVCIPRTDIVAVEAETPLSEVIEMANQHGVSKMPVYEDNLDQILGVLHIRDLLMEIQKNQGNTNLQDLTARTLVRETFFVPETISVNDLLLQFRARRMHLAIVLDEYGGTSGLVTLEDLLEEIIGEIRDPFDVTPADIETLPDGTIMIDGRVLMEEINGHFDLHLEDSNYDTLAGYLLGKLGRIPKTGDTYEDQENHIVLKVETMERQRIARISLRHL